MLTLLQRIWDWFLGRQRRPEKTAPPNELRADEAPRRLSVPREEVRQVLSVVPASNPTSPAESPPKSPLARRSPTQSPDVPREKYLGQYLPEAFEAALRRAAELVQEDEKWLREKKTGSRAQ